jgi:hypothetical protein|tara:strand:+ start:104 stop:349 length:246 start_codon:yes stop_codon:yes gene_type:complete
MSVSNQEIGKSLRHKIITQTQRRYLVNKITAITTSIASSPWWFFPGLDVARECFTCYLIGQLATLPLFFAIAVGIAYLMGD